MFCCGLGKYNLAEQSFGLHIHRLLPSSLFLSLSFFRPVGEAVYFSFKGIFCRSYKTV